MTVQNHSRISEKHATIVYEIQYEFSDVHHNFDTRSQIGTIKTAALACYTLCFS